MINKNKKIMKMILEKNKKVSMGNRSGLGFLDDPVRLTFTLSRYKFVAKMFEGFNNVLEIGAGDGFKSPIVGQFCKKLTLSDIESDKVTNSVLKVSNKCKEIGIDFVVGGAVSYDARKNLKKFKESYLSRFETRKVIFDSKALELKDLEQGLKDAVHFELLWLLNKRDYYSGLYKEDTKRIEMLESRWKILNEN